MKQRDFVNGETEAERVYLKPPKRTQIGGVVIVCFALDMHMEHLLSTDSKEGPN
jgi:hypothetical protein